MDEKRPFDFLSAWTGKNIFVRMKNGLFARGVLMAFDVHLNLVLDNAEIVENEKVKKYGKMLIRGDTVIFVSP
jgi:small nuclear ribonucleoprotein